MYSTQSRRSISPLLLWRWRLDTCFYRFSAVSPKVIGCSDLCFSISLSLFRFHRHATRSALPARGRERHGRVSIDRRCSARGGNSLWCPHNWRTHELYWRSLWPMFQNRPTPHCARCPWYWYAVKPTEHDQHDKHWSEDSPANSGEPRFGSHSGRWTNDSSATSSPEWGQRSSLWSSGTSEGDVDEWSSRSSRPCWEHSGRGNFQKEFFNWTNKVLMQWVNTSLPSLLSRLGSLSFHVHFHLIFIFTSFCPAAAGCVCTIWIDVKLFLIAGAWGTHVLPHTMKLWAWVGRETWPVSCTCRYIYIIYVQSRPHGCI